MSLFVRMLREEWRFHGELFGGRRFAAFPLAVFGLTAAGTWLLGLTGTDDAAIAAGLHGLVGLFGLQVGTIGLIGRDALRDVVGDVTMLIFSARTLPLSVRRLLATFLVKDLCYYGAFVVTPVVAGFGVVTVAGGRSPSTVALAWATVTLSFGLGVAASLTLAAVGTRSPAALLAGVGTLAAGVLATGVDPLALTPYGLYADPTPETFALAVGPVVLLSALGVLLFEPADGGERGRRRAAERALVALAPDAYARRPLLAVTRSSGSFGKVLFSLGVMFAVATLVLRQVVAATGIRPAPGIALGTLLGLGAFTTYSWVTTFDEPREYLRYPVSYGAVFRGKRRAYLILSGGAGLAYLALATYWYPPADLIVGAVVMPLVGTYVFGVAAYLTGPAPNELLFDTPLFLAFGGALAALTVPLLVAALAHQVAPDFARATALGVALTGGGAGTLLSRRAGPRWDRRLRE